MMLICLANREGESRTISIIGWVLGVQSQSALTILSAKQCLELRWHRVDTSLDFV